MKVPRGAPLHGFHSFNTSRNSVISATRETGISPGGRARLGSITALKLSSGASPLAALLPPPHF